VLVATLMVFVLVGIVIGLLPTKAPPSTPPAATDYYAVPLSGGKTSVGAAIDEYHLCLNNGDLSGALARARLLEDHFVRSGDEKRYRMWRLEKLDLMYRLNLITLGAYNAGREAISEAEFRERERERRQGKR
jgi:hypothetical protein